MESDTFVLAGSEDLVPVRDANGQRESFERDGHRVYPYRPRVEGGFARIERWVSLADGVTHWQVRTPDNVLSRYGRSPQSRVADPADAMRVFAWQLEEVRDDRGNVARYSYKLEDDEGATLVSDANRGGVAGLYLKRIEYGNAVPNVAGDFMFEVVFDYGEHDLAPDEVRPWATRTDAFSRYRAGFERRTRRRCARVLMFHRIAALSSEPRLVASTDFTYDDAPHLSKLIAATQRAYTFENGAYDSAELPALELEYSPVTFAPRLVELDEGALRNVPAGVDGSSFRFADLDGAGLPGILTQQGDALYYKRPLGEGRFGPLSVVREQPTTARLGQGAQLADLDGDGRLELVVQRRGHAGSYARAAGGGWEPFVSFEDVPNVDPSNPDVQQLDLNGDGRADLLLVEHDRLVWWPSHGRAGYGKPRLLPKPTREAEGPAVLFSDGTATLHLADMSGDGLRDIVRVQHGAVHYWPNLGHGRFGRRVTMDTPPFFAAADVFHPAYLRLADLDGSGTTDLVYLDARGARAWFNRSGNAFSEAQPLRLFPGVDAATAVEVRDLFGKGTASLVWSSAAEGAKPHHVVALDLLPQKPHLLTAVRNNMGAETRLSYEPSTTQSLRDAAAGRPWATTLPFPVQVLTRVEQYDAIARRRFVQTYAYHHGHYDGVEREFRGFAMVERWDTEAYDDFTRDGLFEVELYDRVEAQLHQPPVHTKTWFHTGAYVGHDKVSRQLASEYWSDDPHEVSWRLPDTVFPAGLSARECLEATRALRGRALRSEVYALDGSDEEALPYAVTETNFTVRLEQPAPAPSEVGRLEKPAHAVVFAHARESLSFAYDRDPQNPRVSHQAVLDVDAQGNVTRSAAIAYPARNVVIPEQGQGAVVVSEASFIVVDEADVYRTGVPAQAWSYELHGLPPSPLSKFDLVALRMALDTASAVAPEETAPAGLARRLLSQTRAYYYDDTLAGALPLGQCGTRALPFEQHAAVLSEGQRAAVFGVDADATLLQDEGGYVLDAGLWWTRSGQQVFDPAQFYLPVTGRDPFGNESTVEYDDARLFVTRVVGPLGNVASFEHDYRVLAPNFATDPNGNRTQVGFDTYGRVAWVAAMGKDGAGEGDTPQDPTARFTYGVFAWRDRGEPPSAFSEVRETHGDPSTRWQRSWAYFDASGTTLLAKTTAEPGDAPQRDANGDLVLDEDGNLVLAFSDPRYVGTGRTVFDNKGNPVQQYEPYFSSTPEYESEPQLREQGVSALLYYDPLGRLLRTDLPDGTFATTEFTPWHQVDRDGGDNVLASSWYAERSSLPAGDPDLRAANLSAAYANTPTTTHVDAQGRPVRVVTVNTGGVEALTRTELDITGNPLRIVDARDNVAQENVYGVGGLLLQEDSVDAGQRRALPDVVGNPLRAFDARGFVQRWRYDEGLRPTHHFVTYPNPNGPSLERLVTRMVYGESLPTPEALNLRGRVHRVYDGAGVSTAEAYDFAGNLLSSARQLATEFRETPDWSALSDLEDVTDLEQAAAADLETEVFRTTSTFDALGRPTSQTTPEQSTVRFAYNDASLLERVTANVRGSANETTFVENIDYDEKGRRERIAYGNGTTTTYDYDPRTFLLTRLRTTDASRTFQDLGYTYDAVGNIVEQRDDAQQDIYFNGQLVTPVARYEYDALYRLTEASGREHGGQNSAQPTAFGSSSPHPQDANAMRSYVEQYAYDVVGNILSMQHEAVGAPAQSWTRTYQYAANGNRLLANSIPGLPGDFSHTYSYDPHGNMLAMPHLASIGWDHADRMQSAELGGGSTVYFVYDVAGTRVRKVREYPGGATSERVYLGSVELYRERNASGAVELERETLHISDDGGRICDLETRTVQGGASEPTPTTHHRYQYSNHLGSATLELTANAEVISYEEYHPYGTSSYRAVNSAIDVSARRYRYTGMERDEETGLALHGARYYACWLGRWTAADPLG